MSAVPVDYTKELERHYEDNKVNLLRHYITEKHLVTYRRLVTNGDRLPYQLDLVSPSVTIAEREIDDDNDKTHMTQYGPDDVTGIIAKYHLLRARALIERWKNIRAVGMSRDARESETPPPPHGSTQHFHNEGKDDDDSGMLGFDTDDPAADDLECAFIDSSVSTTYPSRVTCANEDRYYFNSKVPYLYHPQGRHGIHRNYHGYGFCIDTNATAVNKKAPATSSYELLDTNCYAPINPKTCANDERKQQMLMMMPYIDQKYCLDSCMNALEALFDYPQPPMEPLGGEEGTMYRLHVIYSSNEHRSATLDFAVDVRIAQLLLAQTAGDPPLSNSANRTNPFQITRHSRFGNAADVVFLLLLVNNQEYVLQKMQRKLMRGFVAASITPNGSNTNMIDNDNSNRLSYHILSTCGESVTNAGNFYDIKEDTDDGNGKKKASDMCSIKHYMRHYSANYLPFRYISIQHDLLDKLSCEVTLGDVGDDGINTDGKNDRVILTKDHISRCDIEAYEHVYRTYFAPLCCENVIEFVTTSDAVSTMCDWLYKRHWEALHVEDATTGSSSTSCNYIDGLLISNTLPLSDARRDKYLMQRAIEKYEEERDREQTSKKEVTSASSSPVKRSRVEFARTSRVSSYKEAVAVLSTPPWTDPAKGHNSPFPVVIKPVNGCGSEFVSLCYDYEEMRSAFLTRLGTETVWRRTATVVVIQEFLGGGFHRNEEALCKRRGQDAINSYNHLSQEYVIDVVSYDGVHVVSDIWTSRKFPLKVLSTRIQKNCLNDIVEKHKKKKEEKEEQEKLKATINSDLLAVAPVVNKNEENDDEVYDENGSRKKFLTTTFVYDFQELVLPCSRQSVSASASTTSPSNDHYSYDVQCVIEYTLHVLQALNVSNGASHCEVMVTFPYNGDRSRPVVKLIELNPRVQGDIPRAGQIIGYDQLSLLTHVLGFRKGLWRERCLKHDLTRTSNDKIMKDPSVSLWPPEGISPLYGYERFATLPTKAINMLTLVNNANKNNNGAVNNTILPVLVPPFSYPPYIATDVYVKNTELMPNHDHKVNCFLEEVEKLHGEMDGTTGGPFLHQNGDIPARYGSVVPPEHRLSCFSEGNLYDPTRLLRLLRILREHQKSVSHSMTSAPNPCHSTSPSDADSLWGEHLAFLMLNNAAVTDLNYDNLAKRTLTSVLAPPDHRERSPYNKFTTTAKLPLHGDDSISIIGTVPNTSEEVIHSTVLTGTSKASNTTTGTAVSHPFQQDSCRNNDIHHQLFNPPLMNIYGKFIPLLEKYESALRAQKQRKNASSYIDDPKLLHDIFVTSDSSISDPYIMRVVFLYVSDDGVLNEIGRRFIRDQLPCFLRFTRSTFIQKGSDIKQGYLIQVSKTIDIFACPAAVILYGPRSVVDASHECIRYMEDSNCSEVVPMTIQVRSAHADHSAVARKSDVKNGIMPSQTLWFSGLRRYLKSVNYEGGEKSVDRMMTDNNSSLSVISDVLFPQMDSLTNDTLYQYMTHYHHFSASFLLDGPIQLLFSTGVLDDEESRHDAHALEGVVSTAPYSSQLSSSCFFEIFRSTLTSGILNKYEKLIAELAVSAEGSVCFSGDEDDSRRPDIERMYSSAELCLFSHFDKESAALNCYDRSVTIAINVLASQPYAEKLMLTQFNNSNNAINTPLLPQLCRDILSCFLCLQIYSKTTFPQLLPTLVLCHKINKDIYNKTLSDISKLSDEFNNLINELRPQQPFDVYNNNSSSSSSALRDSFTEPILVAPDEEQVFDTIYSFLAIRVRPGRRPPVHRNMLFTDKDNNDTDTLPASLTISIPNSYYNITSAPNDANSSSSDNNNNKHIILNARKNYFTEKAQLVSMYIDRMIIITESLLGAFDAVRNRQNEIVANMKLRANAVISQLRKNVAQRLQDATAIINNKTNNNNSITPLSKEEATTVVPHLTALLDWLCVLQKDLPATSVQWHHEYVTGKSVGVVYDRFFYLRNLISTTLQKLKVVKNEMISSNCFTIFDISVMAYYDALSNAETMLDKSNNSEETVYNTLKKVITSRKDVNFSTILLVTESSKAAKRCYDTIMNLYRHSVTAMMINDYERSNSSIGYLSATTTTTTSSDGKCYIVNPSIVCALIQASCYGCGGLIPPQLYVRQDLFSLQRELGVAAPLLIPHILRNRKNM